MVIVEPMVDNVEMMECGETTVGRCLDLVCDRVVLLGEGACCRACLGVC